MKRICFAFVTGVLALGLISVPASAQYVWIDKNNVKHYSDQPPPSDVPNNRILKSPRNQPAKNISETNPGLDNSGAATATPTVAKPAPMTTAEKNADYNKRKIEQAEKDKKAAEDKSRVESKAKNCERAKEYKRTLDSGQRISRAGKNGEREFLSDEERNNEMREAQEALKDCN